MSQVRSESSTQENTMSIDNVVASHREIGPTPPDGGYGWVILFCAVITQITVPSIISAYGVLLLYLNLSEGYEENEKFLLWEKHVVLIPILMTIFWLLLEPWSRTIILISNSPKIVSISGISFIGAGILLSNFSSDYDETAVIINVFVGFFIGIGAALTTQQAEILLKQYFREKIRIVQLVYKTSIVIGNVLIPVLTGFLFTKYEPNTSLMMYAGIILLQCFLLLLLTRPTYVVNALRKRYKTLEESEDEDEIYTNQGQGNTPRRDMNENVTNNKQGQTVVEQANAEDEQDENVIGMFNTENTVREVVQPKPVLTRYESTQDGFGSNFTLNMDRIDRYEDPPQALYRETTVINTTTSEYSFIYDPPPVVSSGTARRTANLGKNFHILLSVLKDMKFYAYTQVLMCSKFSVIMFGALLPAYISQQQPDMDMNTVILVTTVTYIGASCLTVLTSIISLFGSHKNIIRVCSFVAAFGFIALAESNTRSLLVISGILTIFSSNSIYIALKPIFNNTSTNFDSSAISVSSNCITALLIMLVTFVHNYNYSMCFKIAACFNLLTPFLSFYL